MAFTKQDLINAVADERGLIKSEVAKVLHSIIGHISVTLRNGATVDIRGLVKLEPVAKAARTGRNPKTGEAITIPAKTVVKATASKSLLGGA